MPNYNPHSLDTSTQRANDKRSPGNVFLTIDYRRCAESLIGDVDD